ncbi:response regulator [Granulicella aggregans]|jgi:CheY-like chemotaxis protein|uniref:response regulator n=1 Tax=Granulicella aggregans TaxID=474949 RepID=UPI0021E003A5|nr:response regulator [Granulicella aggregans]
MLLADGTQLVAEEKKPAKPRVLLVDDNDTVRMSVAGVLKHNDFEVVTAANAHEALGLIASQKFEVLVSDLHMPNAGDGLTVVSAMRHSNPEAATIIFSGYPRMKEAAAAIVLQADEILVKPMDPLALVKAIKARLKAGVPKRHVSENVASILDRETDATIADWLVRIDSEPGVITVHLDDPARSSHLPQLFRDLVSRLKNPLSLGTRALVSESAAAHGLLRRQQGYTAAMLVEESRMLQVSIFQTLQNNLHVVDFSVLLVGVMAIADEVDSQLAQAMASYVLEEKVDGKPVHA